MEAQGWLFSLIAPARGLDGRPKQVVSGLLRIQGAVQMVMRVGEYGETVVLPQLAVVEVVANLQKVADKRLKYERG